MCLCHVGVVEVVQPRPRCTFRGTGMQNIAAIVLFHHILSNFAYDKLRLGNWSKLRCPRTCIVFAYDKLRLGNWSKLHCSRTCIVFAYDKLRLGNRSKLHCPRTCIVFALLLWCLLALNSSGA